jgi:hypothetical protein
MPIQQKIIPNRIVIYAQDIRNMTGRSERSARSLLQRIRNQNNKTHGQFVTITEFCQYSGLKEEDVKRFLL